MTLREHPHFHLFDATAMAFIGAPAVIALELEVGRFPAELMALCAIVLVLLVLTS